MHHLLFAEKIDDNLGVGVMRKRNNLHDNYRAAWVYLLKVLNTSVENRVDGIR